MSTRTRARWISVVALTVLIPSISLAGIKNGNELALEFSLANLALQKEFVKDSTGKLFFFRYLRIVKKEIKNENGRKSIVMRTVEPSSDMIVNFVVRKKVSLQRATPIEEGQAIAVTGRVKSLNWKAKQIMLDPVIVKYKDRSAPKIGIELLHEVDPNARRGTDTSSGKDVIVK